MKDILLNNYGQAARYYPCIAWSQCCFRYRWSHHSPWQIVVKTLPLTGSDLISLSVPSEFLFGQLQAGEARELETNEKRERGMMGTNAERERAVMGRKKWEKYFPLPITPFDPAFLNNYLKYPQKLIANDWGRSNSLNVNIEEMIN